MRPRYVEVKNGESRVLWGRFLLFAFITIGLGFAIGELIAYVAMHRFGFAAPAFGAIIGLMLVVRKWIEIMAYQPVENDSVTAP